MKKKSLKQKDEREFVEGRVADNLSLRKKKREERLGDSRGFVPSKQLPLDNEFARLCQSDLKAACGMAFERTGQTRVPEAVLVGLLQLEYLSRTSQTCQPVFPEIYNILPAQNVMERLCVLLKTTAPELQEHVCTASRCIAQLVQSKKPGDLEYRWSNAVKHAQLVPVITRHILENPSMDIRIQMLYAAIHYAKRSRQNAIDARLSGAMLALLMQNRPETFEFVSWYVSEMCCIKPALDWAEFIGDKLWSFMTDILKECNEPSMIYDATVALAAIAHLGEGTRFKQTYKDVGVTRLLELLHRDNDAILIKELCRVLVNVAIIQDELALRILQRGHTKFLPLLTEDKYSATCKVQVLHLCHLVTSAAEPSASFIITQGYFDQALRFLERTQSRRHMEELVDMSLELVTNIVQICEEGCAPYEVFARVYSSKMTETICTHIHVLHPNRQRYAMLTMEGLLRWARRFDMFKTVCEDMEEQQAWEKISSIYNTTADPAMQEVTECLMKLGDRNGADAMDMD